MTERVSPSTRLKAVQAHARQSANKLQPTGCILLFYSTVSATLLTRASANHADQWRRKWQRMNRIRFAQVSDLHFSAAKAASQAHVIGALCESIKQSTTDAGLDFVIFSGDLIFSADDPADLELARDQFLKPLAAAANIPLEKIFITPGNHDISRKAVRDRTYVELGLKLSLVSAETVNQFVNDGWNDRTRLKEPLLRMEAFDSFLSKFPKIPEHKDHLWTQTYKFDVRGQKIGIACFNTAWRAKGEGEADRGLILGEAVVETAFKDLEQTDLRIAVLHHPLDWLAEFDRKVCDPLLQSRFNVICTGHLHQEMPEIRKTLIGDSLYLSCGCLYESREYPNSYHIVDIDSRSLEFTVSVKEYVDNPLPAFVSAVRFQNLTNGVFTGSLDTEVLSDKTRGVHRFLNHAMASIKHRADRQITLISTKDATFEDFRETFVCPPIARYRDGEIATRTKTATGEEENYEYWSSSKILQEHRDVVIHGARESGKSSLAYALAVECSRGDSDRPRVPVVFDCLKTEFTVRNFERVTRSQFSDLVGTLTPLPMPLTLPILALLDNFPTETDSAHKELRKLKEKYPDLRSIMLVSIVLSRITASAGTTHLNDTLVLYIHPLPRRQIRLLAGRLSKRLDYPDSSGSDVSDRVMSQIQQGGLPKTGYIVTLLLHALKLDIDFQSINESVLLQNVMDVLLNKRGESSRAAFDSRLQELLLSELAHFLPHGASIGYNDVLDFILKLLRQKALKFQADEILRHLIVCGILEKFDDQVAFRFSIFQHYFHSVWLRDNVDYLTKLQDTPQIIELDRELDLLSGLSRREDRLVVSVAKLIEQMAPADLAAIPMLDFMTMPFDNSLGTLSTKRVKQLTDSKLRAEEVDELLDRLDERASQHLAKKNEKIDAAPVESDSSVAADNEAEVARPILLFRAVALLGRLVRNSEFSDGAFKKGYVISFFEWNLRIATHVLASTDKIMMEVLKVPDEERREKIERILKSIIQMIIPLMLAEISKKALNSPKMAEVLVDISRDEHLAFSIRLFAGLCLLDIEDPRAFPILKSIAENCQGQMYPLTVLFERVANVFSMRGFREELGNNLANLLGDIVVAAGVPSSEKGRFVDERRARDALGRSKEGGNG